MIKKYTLIDDKPNFKDGDIIKIDMSCFGLPPSIEEGKIVGKSSAHVMDNWIVQFKHILSDQYPFKIMCVPHTYILKEKD